MPKSNKPPLAFKDVGLVALSSVTATNTASNVGLYPSLKVSHVYSSYADGASFGYFKFIVNSIDVAAGTANVDYVYTTSSTFGQ